jgi:N,N'-diacetyllegionaminate synthase
MERESLLARVLQENYRLRGGERSRVIVIAEAGVNHNGDAEIARRLIAAAKEAGADAVKFQTFQTENIVTRHAEMATYQKTNVGHGISQYEMLKSLELGFADFRELRDFANRSNIEFLSTPDDEASLDFLVDELGMAVVKIGSGEVTNLPFLAKIAAKRKPMILSSGMASLGEVEAALGTLRIAEKPVTVLHCTTSYPCDPPDANLLAMSAIRSAFNVPVGYSDHTLGCEVSLAAVALGATVIEKHFTLDKHMTGPDHAASLDVIELAEFVRGIRKVEAALGDGIKRPTVAEQAIKASVRRRVVAAHDLSRGATLSWQDLVFKRAGSGIDVENAGLLIGMTLARSVAADCPIDWPDVCG